MNLRKGIVRLGGTRVGTIEETASGSRFAYDPAWVTNPGAVPVSLTMPIRAEPYESAGLLPFFDNLLPEGWLLELVSRKLHVSFDDSFGLLLHLKNFSLLVGTDGIPRLSPAYDLLNTRRLVPGDTLAMPISGKKDRLTMRRWRELAGYMVLPERAVRRVHAAVSETLDRMLALVAASPLPEKSREEYAKLLRTRAKDLSWRD